MTEFNNIDLYLESDKIKPISVKPIIEEPQPKRQRLGFDDVSLYPKIDDTTNSGSYNTMLRSVELGPAFPLTLRACFVIDDTLTIVAEVRDRSRNAAIQVMRSGRVPTHYFRAPIPAQDFFNFVFGQLREMLVHELQESWFENGQLTRDPHEPRVDWVEVKLGYAEPALLLAGESDPSARR
jgi:hypothetical protein